MAENVHFCGISECPKACKKDLSPNELESVFYAAVMARGKLVLKEDVLKAFWDAMDRVYA